MTFHQIQPGDTVIRILGGVLPVPMQVTEVDDTLIHCGAWTFDRESGAEVDHGLRWGPQYGITGSYLVGEVE